MFDFWKDELSEEEIEQLLDRAEEEIRKRKLETAAVLYLESHKPLAFVGSQAALIFSPFLVPFFGFDFMNKYSQLLSKRENIEKLLNRLESSRSRPEAQAEAPEDSCPK